jgi:hypothetical protein
MLFKQVLKKLVNQRFIVPEADAMDAKMKLTRKELTEGQQLRLNEINAAIKKRNVLIKQIRAVPEIGEIGIEIESEKHLSRGQTLRLAGINEQINASKMV